MLTACECRLIENRESRPSEKPLVSKFNVIRDLHVAIAHVYSLSVAIALLLIQLCIFLLNCPCMHALCTINGNAVAVN